MSRITLVFIAISSLFGANFTEKLPRDSTTTRLDAAPTIHLVNSRGEVTIEGWDQPSVEVTVIRYAMHKGIPLDRLQVKSERHGDEIEIRTEAGKDKGRDVLIDYVIKAPRGSKIVMNSAHGGAYVSGITGEIEASLKKGELTLRVANAPALDAHTRLGQVYSEFDDQDKRRHGFNHDVTAQGSGQKLSLKTDCGDIVILKDVIAP